MRLQTVGVGRTAVGPRISYGADTRFGRATVRPRAFFSGVLVILVVGLVLRVWNLGAASLWTDEAMTAIRAQASFEESLASLLATGNQSPLYFWSLRLVPNTTETLLRLPSALLGLAGVALMMFLIVQLYQDRELALWIGALLAVNPYHVWLSRTARPYSLMFVLAVLSTYFFLMLLRGNRSRTMWIGFTLTSIVAYSTHFTAVALPAVQYVLFAFVLRERHAMFRRWIASQAVAAVPALVWTYIMLNQPLKVASEWIPDPELRDIPLSLWNMVLGYDGVFRWHMVPGLMVVTLGVVFGIGQALRERGTQRNNFYWVLLIVIPLVPVYIMSRFFVSIYVDRYFMVLLPALLVLMAVGLMRYSPQVWRGAMVVVILTGAYTVLFSFYDGSYQRTDWRSAAAYVAEGYRPGDAIVLERDNTEQAFSRYFEAEAQIASRDLQSHVMLMTDTPDPDTLDQSAVRLWVVYRNPNEDVHRMGLMPEFDPFDSSLTPMGEWLSERQEQVIEQRSYNGVRILLIDTRQPMAVERP